MKVQFFYDNTAVGGVQTGVSRVVVKHDADMFYIVENGQKTEVNCISAESVTANEKLRIYADGSSDEVWWHVQSASMTYKDHTMSGVPESSAKWEESYSPHTLRLEVTGPSKVSHEVLWDFTGPSQPAKPLKVVIKRRT